MNDRFEDERRERQSYRIGFAAAALLTAIPFALVATGATSRGVALVVIGVLAVVQAVVHFRWFLHIDLSRQKREDLQLILFSTLLLILMAGGTVWVLADLARRMTPSP